MINTSYPAIFRKETKGYFVEFPDLKGCLTEGETLDEAIKMAGDALHIWLVDEDKNSNISKPSSLEVIKEQYANDIVLLIKPQNYVSSEAKKYMLNAVIEDSLEKKGYTIKKLAKKLKMDFDYLTKIINCETTPTLAEANMIAYTLDIEPQLFYQV